MRTLRVTPTPHLLRMSCKRPDNYFLITSTVFARLSSFIGINVLLSKLGVTLIPLDHYQLKSMAGKKVIMNDCKVCESGRTEAC